MKKRVAKKRRLLDYEDKLIFIIVTFNKKLSDIEMDEFIDKLIIFTDKRKHGWGGGISPDDAHLGFHSAKRYWKNRLTWDDYCKIEEFLIDTFSFVERVEFKIETEEY